MFRSFGEYELIESRQTFDAFSSYYLASTGETGRVVELRVLNLSVFDAGGDPQGAEGRLDELRKVNHPYLVRLAYCGIRDGLAFTVTDPVETISFSTYLAQNGGRIDPELALDMLVPIGEALAALHARGFVHGSINPDSVRIEVASERAFLGTIDLCSVLGLQRPRLPNRELGAGELLSPEAAEGLARTPRTDAFLWAALLHQALTGRQAPRLAEAAGRETAALLKFVAPSSASALPPEIDPILGRSLSVQAEQRHEGLRPLLDELQPLRAAVSQLAKDSRSRSRAIRTPDQPPTASERRKKKRRQSDSSRDQGPSNPLDAIAEWVFELGTVTQLVLFLGFAFLSFRVPMLVGNPVAFMGAEYETTRLAIANKSFNRKAIQDALVVQAEEAMATPTNRETYEGRLRTLRRFAKALNEKDRNLLYPPALQVELRLTYAKTPKKACAMLDALLVKALESYEAAKGRTGT